MIQVLIINILVMRSRGRTEKSKNGQKQNSTKAKKGSESNRTNPPKMRKYFNTPTIKVHDPMITWYRWRTEKSKSGQKHHRTKAKKGSESKRTKPPKMKKYFNTPTIKVYEPMIAWYRCAQSTFLSCDHVGGQRKAKVEKSTTGRKPKKDQNQSGQNPKKWENILILQHSRCTIPWSHDTDVDNQHSRHAITWADREKQKWTKVV